MSTVNEFDYRNIVLERIRSFALVRAVCRYANKERKGDRQGLNLTCVCVRVRVCSYESVCVHSYVRSCVGG